MNASKPLPLFPMGLSITAAMAKMCVTPRGMVQAIAMYNNCNVVEVKGSWALIQASMFAASGIARQLALPVYQAKRGQGFYAVRLERSPSVLVEVEGDDSTKECSGCEHCDGEGGHTVADSKRQYEATERFIASRRAF